LGIPSFIRQDGKRGQSTYTIPLPSWTKAIYSFSGENKSDLGFVEGDLIECLNAGDGSWWMGRLRRDKRMMGLFPSNFVQVLDDSFQPASRASSPMPDHSPSPNPFNPQPPQKTKTKAFRKPFTAYAAPDAAAQRRAQIKQQESISVVRAPSTNPRSIHDGIPRVPSPEIPGYGSRAPSPAPQIYSHNSYGSIAPSPSPQSYHNSSYGSRAPSPAPSRQNSHLSRAHSPAPSRQNSYMSRAPSPAPPRHNSYISRAPSPAPPVHSSYGSRAPSPAPSFQYVAYSREPTPPEADFDIGSSPPPPPPPHRTIHTPHQSTGSYHRPEEYHTPRAASPCPPSPGGTGLTPSPLRSAMDDVMSSLYDMGASREMATPDQPLDPWSPEAFDQTYIKAKRNGTQRPNTALGLGAQNEYDDNVPQPYIGGSQSRNAADQPPPQLSNYVRRMEDRLNKMHTSSPRPRDTYDNRPAVPPKNSYDRPKSIAGNSQLGPKLRHRKSAYEVGRSILGRTLTTKTNSTSSSSGARSTTTDMSASTQMTDKSIMSGPSASGFSSTSAGSLARRKEALHGRSRSAFGSRRDEFLGANGSQVDFGSASGVSYHSSHASGASRPQSQSGWHTSTNESGSILGGLVAPKPKKSGFFKKIIESAKTGAASARSSIAVSETARPALPSKMANGVTSIAGGFGNSHSGHGNNAANDMGLGVGGIDWVQVRRDVNRSNTLSRIERVERKERCQMMDYPAISPVEELFEGCEGDEGADGNPVVESTDFHAVNLSLVDKNSRFINSLPPMTNPVSLATGFVCRPYRSDVQRLRAIFTWVSEKINWEDGLESDPDSRRVIQTKRGCAEEVAVLVLEMCAAVGIHAEVVRGYLKTPGEVPELGIMPRPNHFWNAVIVDGEWRIIDCSLASPSNPQRGQYSSAGGQVAESWWFLTRPTEICWTHIPEQHEQQHLCPPMAFEVLLALPCACPPYFKNALHMADYDTSLVRIEDLELIHIKFTVPSDIECVAEVEARAFERDADGDFFESGDVIKKRALSQAEWIGGQKRYTVKALLPGDEGHGTLKVYAGKRGLMHSIKDIPHPLAFALPIIHTGDNPAYEFLTRHPTPHAQRHDLYVAQPQCQRLALNNTFVFAVRQHPSSLTTSSSNPGGASPIPFMRPSSAMSTTESAASGSNPSTSSAYTSKKPAKLAIQSPGGKVLRLMRKEEKIQVTSQGLEKGDGGTWETIIKVGERGVWRGLVLADRSARWCVFAEWTCV
ncbi:cytokinesis protein, partial [Lachnellula subtilissima]